MRKNVVVYFASMSLSLAGNGMAAVVFPLFVLARTGDVFAAGVIASVTAGTGMVAGLLGGVVADRVNRRDLSAAADILSGLSVAGLVLADAVGMANMAVLIALSVVGALADVPGMTARETVLPALAESGTTSLDRLVAIRETLTAAMILIGPAIGGVMVAWLGVDARVFWITAGTSVTAALLTLCMNRELGSSGETRVPRSRASWPEITQGIRAIASNRVVRTATLLSTVIAAAMVVLQTTVLPAYYLAVQKPQMVGFVLTAIAVGTMVGGGTYAVLGTHGLRQVWLGVSLVATGIGLIIVGALFSPWAVLAAAVAVGIVSAPASAVLGVATIEATKPSELGRVLGAQNAVVLGGPALVAAPMAALASSTSLRTVGIALGALVLLTALWAAWDRSFRDIDPVGSEELRDKGGDTGELEHQGTR